MKKALIFACLNLLALWVLLLSCESPPALPSERQAAVLDTSYVEVQPSFSGFSGPEAILIGRDQLLYVADTRANRLVMLNRAGQFLSAKSMLHPVSIGQDTRLDLLVGGEIIAASGDSVAAIFRIHLVSESPDSAHRLEVTPIETLWVEAARPARRFPGIAVFGDNEYLVVRNGPNNSSFIDPDSRVLQFTANDEFMSPISDLATRIGNGITDINFPTGIAAFPSKRDFVLVQSSQGVAYGAIWMVYYLRSDFQGWLPRFNPEVAQDRTVDFIRPFRYLLPTAVAIDGSRGDIFIADAGLDSVFKFTSRGRFQPESFGIVRSDSAMRYPSGLAFFEKMLYVLDKDRGEILRFRLSSDVPR